MLLKRINLPNDVKKLNISELSELSQEVRSRIVEVTLQNGGHIGASLGAVELIVSLLYVFDAEKDKIVFDVGHQAYAYKILTGRNAEFDSLRTFGGISGFPKPSESKYDSFVGGHAGNAISAACGYAKARELSGENYEVISVLGDGVMVNGETAEGLNLASSIGKQIIVLNDNTYSISEGVGSVPEYLKALRAKPCSTKLRKGEESPFAHYDLSYIGPVCGHDIPSLVEAFETAKNSDKSVVLHIVTSKGKGYLPAEQNPLKLHGVPPKGERDAVSFGSVFGKTLVKLREKDDKIVAIAAAMAIGTGLSEFVDRFPNSFIDVGIAESTAVSVAAALARAGFKPYVAIYSTFLQRAYDQMLYDVAMDDLGVTFIVDRAGIVGEDGESHQGIYDLCLLSSVSSSRVFSPSSGGELEKMLEYCASVPGLKVIRYPKGSAETGIPTNADFPHWVTIKQGNSNAFIFAHGARMVQNAMEAASVLEKDGISVGVVNARSIKPFDSEFLSSVQGARLFVLEDVVYSGSLSENLLANGFDVSAITLPDGYVTFGKVSELQRLFGLDAESVAAKIKKEYETGRFSGGKR